MFRLSHRFPKSIIEINILVLEADGGIIGAAITAASLALVDSGILAYDMVACCSVVCYFICSSLY
jgi:ribonuclease PH